MGPHFYKFFESTQLIAVINGTLIWIEGNNKMMITQTVLHSKAGTNGKAVKAIMSIFIDINNKN